MKTTRTIALKSIISAAVLACVSTPAAASAIVWKDPVHGYTISYPDSWTVQTPDTAFTRLRVAGPLGMDLATCRVKVMDDGRGKIYPKEYMDEEVSREMGIDYWKGEAAQYEAAEVTQYFEPAGLGSGDATGVRVSFLLNDGAGEVPMSGIMLGSMYGGKRYLASCSAKAEVFKKWEPVFVSILDSVDLDSRYHPFKTGYYRDFVGDPPLTLPREKPGTEKVPRQRSFYRKVHDWLFLGKYHQ